MASASVTTSSAQTCLRSFQSTDTNWNSFLRYDSCIHNSLIERCRTFPDPVLVHIPRAALLSDATVNLPLHPDLFQDLRGLHRCRHGPDNAVKLCFSGRQCNQRLLDDATIKNVSDVHHGQLVCCPIRVRVHIQCLRVCLVSEQPSLSRMPLATTCN